MLSITGAKAEAWCLPIHADASLSLCSPCLDAVERKVDSEYCEPKAARTAASRSPVPNAAPRFSDASAKLPAGTVSRVSMVRPSGRA